VAAAVRTRSGCARSDAFGRYAARDAPTAVTKRPPPSMAAAAYHAASVRVATTTSMGEGSGDGPRGAAIEARGRRRETQGARVKGVAASGGGECARV